MCSSYILLATTVPSNGYWKYLKFRFGAKLHFSFLIVLRLYTFGMPEDGGLPEDEAFCEETRWNSDLAAYRIVH
jgi:hypothetical protein